MKTMKKMTLASRWVRVQQACIVAVIVALAVSCRHMIPKKLGAYAVSKGGEGNALEESVAIASKLVAYQKTVSGAEIYLVPCITSYGVRGGCATKDIPAESTVARIPKAELWSRATLGSGEVGKAFVDITKRLGRTTLDNFCPLAAYHLLHERDLGEKSSWRTHVQHVSCSTNDTALMWTKERIIEDYGAELLKETGAYMASVLETQKVVRSMLKSRMPSLLKYSFEEYLWAYTKCSSRAWGNKLSGEPFMAPGAADILNSGKSPMVYSEVDAKGDFVYTSNTAIKKGEEVLFWYEESRDTDQLLAYGYLPKHD